MKTLLIALVLLSSSLFAQIDSTGLCRVKKHNGIEVYIQSEPIRPYEVTGKVTSDDAAAWMNAASGTEVKQSLNEKIDIVVKNAERKKKKGKLEYDAILTDDGETGTLIKFK